MRTMTTDELRNRAIEYCKKNKRSGEYLNRALGFSSGYVQKFMRGVLDMSEKRKEALENFIARDE